MQHVSCDELLRDQLITRVDSVLSVVEEALRHMPESDVHHFSFLIMHERLMHLRHAPNVVPLQSGEGRRGRSKYLVNLDLVAHCRCIQCEQYNSMAANNRVWDALRLLHGHLSSMGIKVQRSRLRASVQRVDPLQSIARWHQPISRRTYSFAGPTVCGIIAWFAGGLLFMDALMDFLA